jgi:hypothetical protein
MKICRTAGLLMLAITIGTAARAAPPPEGAPDTRNVGDVVTQPVSDMNLQKKEIPAELIAIRDNPYALDGIRKCRDIISAVNDINAVLGPDFDTPVEQSLSAKRRSSAMTIAGGAISSLIPFRFLIREISGANKADAEYREAIYAGVVRRGFLKGYGKSRGCRAPGSPWTEGMAPNPASTKDSAGSSEKISRR